MLPQARLSKLLMAVVSGMINIALRITLASFTSLHEWQLCSFLPELEM